VVHQLDRPLLEVMDQIGTLVGRVVERKRAEAALRQHEELLQKVILTMPVGVWLVNMAGEIIQGNPAGLEIWGRSETPDMNIYSEYKGWWLGSGQPIAPEEWAAARAINRGETLLEEEIIIERLDGSRQIILNSAIPIYDGEQQLGAIIVNQDISERKRMEMELSEVQRRLDEGREIERLQLARELHDMPMQELFAAQYALAELAHSLPDGAAEANIESIKESLQNANKMLRDLCNELRPPTLESFGLRSAIEAYIVQFRQKYNEIQVELDLTDDEPALSDTSALALFRIYQQALGNVVQHAEAKNIWIRIWFHNGWINMEIRDDGKGFQVPARWVELARDSHFGLVGSKERAEHIGGRYIVHSAPGQGTTVRVTAPLAILRDSSRSDNS
jgi:signal transduction histidine kinase